MLPALPSGWVWNEEDLDASFHWRIPLQPWRTLFTKWKTIDAIANPHTHDGPLHLDLGGILLIDTTGQLVRTCFYDIFKQIFELREQDPSGGVVLTGQPGTGKSVWLFYALARLIQMKTEVIMFTFEGDVYLFLGEAVFIAGQDRPLILPEEVTGKLIISLIDTDATIMQPPNLATASRVFPVHATSPNPDRYRFWAKSRHAVIVGMPLWTVHEIQNGLKLQLRYGSFSSMLQSFASRELPVARQAIVDEDHWAALGNDAESIVDVGKIEEKLLDWAFETYGSRQQGSAARDIYNALFTPSVMRASIKDALSHPLDYKHIIQANPGEKSGSSNTSHRIISISPRSDGGNDLFDFEFKSQVIARKALENIDLFSYREAIYLVRFCRLVPGGASFAGCVFESLAHYALAGKADVRGRIGDYHLMSTTSASNASKPIYRWSMSPSSQPSPIFIPEEERHIQRLDFSNPSSFSNVQLDQEYLVPTSPTNPLIDSLLVQFTCHDDLKVVVDIWIYHMTLAARHGGSEKGYEQVRRIIKAAKAYAPSVLDDNGLITLQGKRKKTAKGRGQPQVNVHYVLVCPATPEINRKWEMPIGWTNAHTGVNVTVGCLLFHTGQ